jgi:hypothetical protein
MERRARQSIEWLLLAALLGGAGFAVARAEPAAPAPQYVKFEPIIVPVFIDNRSAGLMSVQVHLEAPGSAARAAIEARRPQLIDAYTDALIRHARLYVDPLAPIDIDRLAEAVRRATTAEGMEAEVLVLEAMAQPA